MWPDPTSYPPVHALQDRYRLVPLEAWGTDWTPPAEVPLQPGVTPRPRFPRQVLAIEPQDLLRTAERPADANPPTADTPSNGAHRPAGHRPRP